MYQNQMTMPTNKAISIPRPFRDNIIQQLQEEMARTGFLDKSPVEMEQYIYESTNSKEEYLEKTGKIIVGLQQKHQRQQSSQLVGPGQVSYGVRPFPPNMQGQYVYQHPQQGQQPTAVLIHTSQGQIAPAQIIRPQTFNVRQMGPNNADQVAGLQAQAQFRSARPAVMQQQQQQPPPQQQIVPHQVPGQIINQQRQQFPQGQQVVMPPQQQPNMVMGQASSIVIGAKAGGPPSNAQQRRGAQQSRHESSNMPQSQIVYATVPNAKMEQQQYFVQQQQQHQQQFQSQPQNAQQQPPQAFQPGPAAQNQHMHPNLQQHPTHTFAPSQPTPSLTRQSRSFTTGIASPAVGLPPSSTGPSPLGPKGGPGSAGPISAMSPAVVSGPLSQPHQPLSQPMPVTIAPPTGAPMETASSVPENRTGLAGPPNITAQSQQVASEEIAEKLKQLAKYKEPLRSIIETFDGHKENSSNVIKMKKILDIISSNTCENMALLRKCEEACIQVVSRYCAEPSVNQIFSNALNKMASAADSIASQQQQQDTSSIKFPNVTVCSNITSKTFSNLIANANATDESLDLGDEWISHLASHCRASEKVSSEDAILSSLFKQFPRLSRAAQRELLFLSDKYTISCRSSDAAGAIVPAEETNDLEDLIAVDFTPSLRCLVDAGAPCICILISPDYPDSPDIPHVVFSPASEVNSDLAAVKRKFLRMYDSVKMASVSDVTIIRLITFFEASILSQ